ncbi:MAG: omega-amidase [Candidatus Paceibacteria bacterium]|jgi:omega-amidase
MRVAALQFDVSSDPEVNWSFVEPQLELAAERGVELVLLPEMWASSFPTARDDAFESAKRDRELVQRLYGKGAELGIALGGSALFADATEGQTQLLNRLEIFDGGASIFSYDKVHLFTPTAEHETFVPGSDSPGVSELRGCKVSGAICYDLRFPEILRMPFRAGAELILISAQWPSPRAAHWQALCIARAVENQCFVLACNRTGEALIGRRQQKLEFPGNSLVVSPYGEILASGEGQQGLVSADIDLQVARHFRVRVPCIKDDRPDLYERWYKS